MGPLEAVKPWSMEGVSGVRGFLDRVWRMIVDDQEDELTLQPALSDADCDEEQNRMLHSTIKKVTATRLPMLTNKRRVKKLATCQPKCLCIFLSLFLMLRFVI